MAVLHDAVLVPCVFKAALGALGAQRGAAIGLEQPVAADVRLGSLDYLENQLFVHRASVCGGVAFNGALASDLDGVGVEGVVVSPTVFVACLDGIGIVTFLLYGELKADTFLIAVVDSVVVVGTGVARQARQHGDHGVSV